MADYFGSVLEASVCGQLAHHGGECVEENATLLARTPKRKRAKAHSSLQGNAPNNLKFPLGSSSYRSWEQAFHSWRLRQHTNHVVFLLPPLVVFVSSDDLNALIRHLLDSWSLHSVLRLTVSLCVLFKVQTFHNHPHGTYPILCASYMHKVTIFSPKHIFS